MVVVEKLGVVNEVPVPNDVPPVKSAYQLIVPAEAVAPKVTVPGPQTEPGVVPVMVRLQGAGLHLPALPAAQRL